MTEPEEKKEINTSDIYTAGAPKPTPGGSRRISKGTRIKRSRNRWVPPLLFLLAVSATILTLMAFEKISGGKKKSPDRPHAADGIEMLPPPTPPTAASDEPAGQTSEIRHLIDQSGAIRDLRHQVDSMQGRGLFAEAAEKVRRQLGASPNSSELKALLGQLYLRVGRLKDARMLLVDALSSDPSNLGARMDLAYTLLNAGDFEGALIVARWVLESAPNLTDAQKVAARACMGAGWNDIAVQHLRIAYDLQSDDLESRNMLALAYLRQGAYARATAHLLDIVKGGGADETTFYNLAVCYAHQRQVEDVTRIFFEAANEIGPAKVAGWLETEDFAPVRATAMFDQARDKLLGSLSQEAKSSLHSPKRDVGLGLMPTVDLRIVNITPNK